MSCHMRCDLIHDPSPSRDEITTGALEVFRSDCWLPRPQMSRYLWLHMRLQPFALQQSKAPVAASAYAAHSSSRKKSAILAAGAFVHSSSKKKHLWLHVHLLPFAPQQSKAIVAACASAAPGSNTTSACGCKRICSLWMPKEAMARRPPSRQRAALPRTARSILHPLASKTDRSRAERFRCGTWKGFIRVPVPSSLACGRWRIFSVCPPRFATGSARAEFVHLNLRPVGSKGPFRSGRKEKDGIVWGLCWNSMESKFQGPGRPGAPVPWRLKRKLKTCVWTPIFSAGPRRDVRVLDEAYPTYPRDAPNPLVSSGDLSVPWIDISPFGPGGQRPGVVENVWETNNCSDKEKTWVIQLADVLDRSLETINGRNDREENGENEM